MFCRKCGKQLPDGARFCTGCGANLEETPVTPVTPVETAAPVAAPEAPAAAPKKLNVKKLAIFIIVPLLIIGIGLGVFFGIQAKKEADAAAEEARLEEAYDKAMDLLKDRQYEQALAAFKEITEYERSEKQIKKLEKWQKEYDDAMAVLEEGNYDSARTRFYELGEYRDSQEMYEFGVTYRELMDQFDAGTDSYGYTSLADQFSWIEEYKDSAQMRDKCYLEACRQFLENGDTYNAEYYSSYLSEEYKEEYQKIFDEICADGRALEAIRKGLQARMSTETDVEYRDALVAEIQAIEDQLDGVFADSTLRYYVECYMDELKGLADCIDEDGTVSDMVAYYGAHADALYYLEYLNSDFGFLEEDEELKAEYVGASDYYEALESIERTLQNTFRGVTVYPDMDGKYYVNLSNYTGYSFTLDLTFTYSLGDVDLGIVNTATIEVPNYEYLKVDVQIPPDQECDTWTANWVISNIQ